RLHSMSALPPIADIGTQLRNVRFVPEADMSRFKRHVRITSALPPESGLMSKHRSVSLFGNLAEGGRAQTGLRFGAIYLRSALCCLPVRELVEVPIARRIEPYCNRVIGARGS